MSARRRDRAGWLALALSLGALWLSGCSSDGDDGVSPGPPTTYSEAEPNDFTANALGALDTVDVTIGGTASGSGDVDLFRVTLTATTDLFVQLDWPGGQDLGFAVSNQQGIFVVSVDTGGMPESCVQTLAAGNHLIRVDSRTNSPANYVLTIGPR